MQYLLDTGILLRLLNKQSVLHDQISEALRRAKRANHIFVCSPQNISEYWNVSTRPAEARGGLGLNIDETSRRLQT